jgi:hypothetical protein
MSEKNRLERASDLEVYERRAWQFYRDTGYFAPGKDKLGHIASPYDVESLLLALWDLHGSLMQHRTIRDGLVREVQAWRTAVAKLNDTAGQNTPDAP